MLFVFVRRPQLFCVLSCCNSQLKMNVSFELLSSMSPKVNKRRKPISKVPTKLALKKYFRKSLALSNANTSLKNESIITIDSDSTCSSEKSKSYKGSPVVISDSESSSSQKTPPKKPTDEEHTPQRKISGRLSNEKFVNIQHWVDDVNNADKDVTAFTELSTVLGDESVGFKEAKTNIAASSTLLDLDTKRLDQMFKKKGSVSSDSTKSDKFLGHDKNVFANPSINQILINDSLISEDLDYENEIKNTPSDHSFEMPENKSLAARIEKKQLKNNTELTLDPSDSIEYENLLDSLYGSSWREKKEDILPLSEPRTRIKKNSFVKKTPNTERHINKPSKCNKNGDTNSLKNTDGLLKILQKNRLKEKALESPWTKSLKNLCDSDTESEDDQATHNALSPIRLTFEDEQNEEKENSVTSPYFVKKIEKNDKFKKSTKNNNEATNKYSFLASLSESVPVEKCDITALIFRKNFQKNREALTAKLFELFNEKVFENKIPKDTPLEWSERLRGTAGMCSCKKITRRTGAVERTAKIVLSTKVLDSPDRLRDTLVHEMCHAATWIVNEISDGHGSFWKSWAHRAMKAFPELPPIRRCHSYVINTKYTYKCTGCGYSIGRHTKSLDTQSKRCGYCLGTFEVLINKISKKGETKSVPATPKKPTGFALFVKENYATFKTPDLKHGDVMKILGQKFADLKVNKT